MRFPKTCHCNRVIVTCLLISFYVTYVALCGVIRYYPTKRCITRSRNKIIIYNNFWVQLLTVLYTFPLLFVISVEQDRKSSNGVTSFLNSPLVIVLDHMLNHLFNKVCNIFTCQVKLIKLQLIHKLLVLEFWPEQSVVIMCELLTLTADWHAMSWLQDGLQYRQPSSV